MDQGSFDGAWTEIKSKSEFSFEALNSYDMCQYVIHTEFISRHIIDLLLEICGTKQITKVVLHLVNVPTTNVFQHKKLPHCFYLEITSGICESNQCLLSVFVVFDLFTNVLICFEKQKFFIECTSTLNKLFLVYRYNIASLTLGAGVRETTAGRI